MFPGGSGWPLTLGSNRGVHVFACLGPHVLMCALLSCVCVIYLDLKRLPRLLTCFLYHLSCFSTAPLTFALCWTRWTPSLWFTGGPTPLTGVSPADHISKMLSSLDSLHQFFHPPFSLFPTLPPRCTHKAQCWDCLTYPISLCLCWKFINSQERSRDEVPSQRYGKLKPMSARE